MVKRHHSYIVKNLECLDFWTQPSHIEHYHWTDVTIHNKWIFQLSKHFFCHILYGKGYDALVLRSNSIVNDNKCLFHPAVTVTVGLTFTTDGFSSPGLLAAGTQNLWEARRI